MPIRVLCLGGSTRADSSSEKALRAAAASVVEAGAEVEVLAGPELVLPIYAPENPERTENAEALVAALRRCDGVILSSPGYHGTLSGLMKNVLDYVEDLRADDRPYLDGLPVGCIAVAYGWQATVTTLQSLRQTVHALRGWPTPLGAAVNASGPVFDTDGQCVDGAARMQLETVARQVVEFARAWHGAGALQPR
ncbi:NAD(P)H-dependent oxidoreductase [Amycolatopsis acidiphila]|uniref:NAD(P)H-dependent oxidoreductase n=1 Tax=Amycolatopsis acidiphila TaxID=715473 RepID=A0A558AIX5_9PSEU|nr:NAD(P)H-dependent oxidoreductase [Amycolatopsis acidiphila]